MNIFRGPCASGACVGEGRAKPASEPSIGGPRQAKACWGEDERRQRLRATNGSPRLSDASEDEAARLSGFREDAERRSEVSV